MNRIIYDLIIWFYALTIWKAILIALCAILFWSLLSVLLSEKHAKPWRILNAAVLIAAIAAVLYATLFRDGMERELILQPFYTFVRAKRNREAYREALMNIILFIPIGLTMLHILPRKWKTSKRIVTVIAFALIFSVMLETLQFIFHLGMSETDDVLTNGIGAVSAMLQVPCSAVIRKVFTDKRRNL